MSTEGRAEGLACADPGARTPIGASGNFISFLFLGHHCFCTKFKFKKATVMVQGGGCKGMGQP